MSKRFLRRYDGKPASQAGASETTERAASWLPSLTREQKIIIALVLFAFLLRLANAVLVDFNVSDENVYTTRSINFLESGLVNTVDESVLFFYVTDAGYHLLGVNAVSARLPAIVFGSLTVLLVFLVGKELEWPFEKAALAGFLAAFSPMYIQYTMGEMDTMTQFFALAAFYFIVASRRNPKLILVSAACAGFAFLTKPFGAFIIPVLAVYAAWNYRVFIKNKWVIPAALLGLLLLTPPLVGNYLLFKEKKVVDIPFSVFLHIPVSMYAGLGLPSPFAVEKVAANWRWTIDSLLSKDSVLMLPLALLGFLFAVSRRDSALVCLGLWSAVIIVFIASSQPLPWHFVNASPGLCLLAAEGLWLIWQRIRDYKLAAYAPYLFIALYLASSAWSIAPDWRAGTPTVQLRDYASRIPANALVVADYRIYRGRFAWALNDKHYLESSLQDLIPKLRNQSASLFPVYFVECVPGDCGWAKDMPPSNWFVDYLKANLTTKKVAVFYDSQGPAYAVYETPSPVRLDSRVLAIADSTHTFYFYPVAEWGRLDYKESYTPKETLDVVLNGAAYALVMAAVLAALLTPFALVYYFLQVAWRPWY